MGINIPLSLEQSENPDGDVRFASYPEIVFLFVGWLSFLILVTFRRLLLVGLVLGQTTLYWIAPKFQVFTYVLPYYGLIAINGVYVLVLYFSFNYEKWQSGSLEGTTEEYERID